MIHEQRTSDQKVWDVAHGSRVFASITDETRGQN